ncbi:MrcB family domain-containing protein [Streptomyces thermolilacinus]|uniref:Type IV methyl-directed restriction enzyme EcoKMcrB subunit DNA-binding domain-containing protein n=1 Tax=Streptomyces thermolilacinus SPC6 TaxID=1306406 RepID=A0A1D3DUV9_9ACTN|nr:DUF3578 domain-containing protein [Streptomyces thermolilacinus]OEJ96103.1 hypothetical protein J116_018145 [Streptomyces thermolilacinus SPC6]
MAEVYDPQGRASNDHAGQALLRSVKGRADLPLPPRCYAVGYGGQGTASTTPWIGVYDWDINNESHDGLYLAYIFDTSRTSVTLTLQQGVTALQEEYGKGEPLRRILAAQAETLRAALRPDLASLWRDALRLHAEKKHWRPRAYESANVAARRYEIADLPAEERLASDLRDAVSLLHDAAAAHRLLTPTMPSPSEPVVDYPYPNHQDTDPLAGFRAKGSDGYVVDVQGGTYQREQRHEVLIRRFAHHAAAKGFHVHSRDMHPRDLVLRESGDPLREWLVEGKVVKAGNARLAVREAVAQLYEYRHFEYRRRGLPDPRLMALFTDDVQHYAAYLDTLGIAAIWQCPDGGWAGSPRAMEGAGRLLE